MRSPVGLLFGELGGFFSVFNIVPLTNFHLLIVSVLALSTFSACQSIPGRNDSYQIESLSTRFDVSCSEAIHAFRRDVVKADVVNAGAPALSWFPLLHSNRFLFSLAAEAKTSAEIREWTSLASELAASSRSSENKNLDSPWNDADMKQLTDCSTSFATESQFDELRQVLLSDVRQQRFPDSYIHSRQYFAVLALLRPFLKLRILTLHEDEQTWMEEEEYFRQANVYQMETGIGFEGLSEKEISTWMQRAYQRNALELPLLKAEQINSLFVQYAPQLNIESNGSNDKIGSPIWQRQQLTIDTSTPRLYTLASMTRFADKNLLQLNYVFWFSERKPESFIDLYSGKIDSIIWRVTLDEKGQVLLYDSIHSCGCYHKYFPVSERLRVRAEPSSSEPANIFELENLNKPAASGAVILTITSNNHYLVGIDAYSQKVEEPAIRDEKALWTYTLSPYDSLRNIASGSHNRSLFDSNGLISGSERLERFTLWPTGILSVGAMRQWGTHATGFIEEQHFDDAELFGYYFELLPEP